MASSPELMNGAPIPTADKPESGSGSEGSGSSSVAPAGLAVQESETLEQKLEKIPVIEFVEDVDAYMLLPENGQNAQETLKKIEDVHHRMKVLEASNVSTKRRLQSQLSEFEKALEIIEELKARNAANESMSTHFRLADHVYLKAKVKPNQKIGLWLGANVMLEYDIDEGEALLIEKKGKAQESLTMTNTLIDTVREQLTTIEVNMARIYNWDVKRRQLEKEQMLTKKE